MKISIVTVVYNDVCGIRETINSVLEQSYDNIEFIVVDGGSTDGTIQVIEEYFNQIAYFISEPDRGVYDAMNKGANVATGEWIIYMNSGDCFFEKDVLAKIFVNSSKLLLNVDAIFSDMVCSENSRVIKARGLLKIWIGNPCSHQSFFVKTHLMKERPFDLKYVVSADYDFIYNLYYNKCSFLYLKDIVIAKCISSVGLSKTHSPYIILRDSFLITKKYANNYHILCKFIYCVSAYILAKIRKF
ncbi:glycosyltransferase family 2 protein [Bacteroides nordii]|uniref:Glycosyltransferase n=1 Tax=Bacteroides nordii TaxID=291645 RepID=A0A413VM63_9BACE|nr:glycosyltransferase family 2 protein [Bacteroides nordii]RHB34718.1 glycosyltransferase [Bacteroides nordii]